MRRDQTFEDGIGRGHVLRPIHASPKSSKAYFVLWSLKPGPHVSLEVECFVKGGLVRFEGMAKFRVEKSLSQITGALEALVEPVEVHQDLDTVRKYGERLLHMS